MTGTQPTPGQVKDLRMRHKISRRKLAESLYGVKEERIMDWELGRRGCPAIVWWAMTLTWDKRDLWEEES